MTEDALRSREVLASHRFGSNYFDFIEPPPTNGGRPSEDSEPYITVSWIDPLLLRRSNGRVPALVIIDNRLVDRGHFDVEVENWQNRHIIPRGFKRRFQGKLGRPVATLHPTDMGGLVIGDRTHLNVENGVRERAIYLKKLGDKMRQNLGIVHIGLSPKMKH